MSSKYDFEYIIIGSGIAGRTAALELARGGKKVALVEGGTFGGAELNTRDYPYELSLSLAREFRRLKDAEVLRSDRPTLNFATLASRQASLIKTARADWQKLLTDAGVALLFGYAIFADKHTINIGVDQHTAAHFILASGAHLKASEIAGLDSVDYLTPETALKLQHPPKFVLVVGGGPAGCEIASYFAELGIRVLVMERLERILPREDEEVSAAVTTYFKEKLGVMVVPHARVVKLEQDAFSKRVIFNNNSEEKMVRVDCVVLATGSEPTLDYGLENAKVKYKNSGIIVDKSFATSAKNIYAIGDAIDLDFDLSSLRAYTEARILTANLLHKHRNIPGSVRGRGGLVADYSALIRNFHIAPEVTVIGMNERDLVARDRKFRAVTLNFDEPSVLELPFLAHLAPEATGFIKLLVGRAGVIYGASIVGTHSQIIATEISLAIREQVPLERLLTVGGLLAR